MKKKLARGLTHIFGMTGKRDAMLGDLLYTLRTENLNMHAEDLAVRLAYSYHQSEDVARCLSAAVDFIEMKEGPSRAYNLAFRMAMEANSGPVSIVLGTRLPELKIRAEMEPKIKKAAMTLIDRIRRKDIEGDMSIMPTLFCYNRLDPNRRKDFDLAIKPVNTYQFIYELER